MSEHERQRRVLICTARERVLQIMGEFTGEATGLTPLEWLEVLEVIGKWVRTEGLAEEWKENGK